MKLKDFLTAENWTQGAFARNSEGKSVSACSDEACSFCISGAIQKLYQTEKHQDLEIFKKIMSAIRSEAFTVSTWNDEEGRTFEEVHELLIRLDV